MTVPKFEKEKYQHAYSQDGLWKKLSRLAKKGCEKILYLALLLYYVLVSEEVGIKEKATIIGALGYLIIPVDLIPDFIPMAGYTDDLAAMVAAYQMIRSNITPAIKAKAEEKSKSLFGDFDVGKVEAEIKQIEEQGK